MKVISSKVTWYLELAKKHRKFDSLIAILVSVLLYIFFSTLEYKFLLFSIVLVVFIVFKPKMLLFSFSIFVTSYIVKRIFCAQSIDYGVNGDYKVIDVISFGPIVRIKGERVLINTYDDVFVGDVIRISGNIVPPSNYNNDFNFVGYLESQNIKNYIKINNVIVTEESHDLRAKLFSFMLNSKERYLKFAPLLVMGEKTDQSKQVYDIALRMNVVHLFVISGFHLSLINTLVIKAMSKMRISEKKSGALAIALLAFYTYILSFGTSATRALLLILFNYINKHFLNKKYSSLELLNFVFILMFATKPWSVTSLSFIYTFVATYSVIIANEFKYKTEFRKFIFVSMFAYFSTLLISITTNGFFSPFGFFYGIALSPLFVLYYVVSITLFPFKELLNILYIPFDFLLTIFDSINFLVPITFLNIEIIQWTYLLFFSCIIISKKWNTYLGTKN